MERNHLAKFDVYGELHFAQNRHYRLPMAT
jgi:hypothetical protein